MGKRGPAPHPTRLRVLRGETKPSRVNTAEPQPRAALPEPPPNADDLVLLEWHRVVAELDHMGLAFAADQDAIYAYCCAVVEHHRAVKLIAHTGILLNSDGHAVRNPAVIVARDAAALVLRFARELGLTPSARVNFAGKGAEEPDAGARLLSG